MSFPNRIELTVGSSETGMRVDRFLHHRFPERSRSSFQNLIDESLVVIAGISVKSSYKVTEGEVVSVTFPPSAEPEVIPQKIPIDIIYEDRDIIVLNKPAGLVVHPGAGVRDGTLVNGLVYLHKNLSAVGGRLRPGIVHRLDKNTSGLLVVAKNDEAHWNLSRQFSEKSAYRIYFALVWFPMKEKEGKIETYLNRSKRDRTMFAVAESGRKAITFFQVEKSFQFLTLLRVRLMTGRTHQIRIHLNHIHHPVFGDPEYHGRLKQINQLERQADHQFARHLLGMIFHQALHARELGFVHPATGREVHFEAPLPPDFKNVLDALEKRENEADRAEK